MLINKMLTQTEQRGEGGVCLVFWFLSYCEREMFKFNKMKMAVS